MLRMLRENALGSEDRSTSIRTELQQPPQQPPQQPTIVTPLILETPRSHSQIPETFTKVPPHLHNEGGGVGLETIRGRLAAQRAHVPKPNGCRGCK
jgi:hypothetical protein